VTSDRMVSPRATRAALAVYGGARTVREVRAAVGLGSTSTTFQWLAEARAAGLVAWEPRKAGTLRPTVEVVMSERELQEVTNEWLQQERSAG
jgi:transposase-like protein